MLLVSIYNVKLHVIAFTNANAIDKIGATNLVAAIIFYRTWCNFRTELSS